MIIMVMRGGFLTIAIACNSCTFEIHRSAEDTSRHFNGNPLVSREEMEKEVRIDCLEDYRWLVIDDYMFCPRCRVSLDLTEELGQCLRTEASRKSTR